MIKRLLSLLSVVTLLAACNDSEKGDIIAGNTPTNAISFSVFHVEASRAVETTTSTLHQNGNSIAVTAIQHNGKWNRGNLNNPYTIMDNVQVTYNSGTWSYSPVAYWPTASGSYVSFFSYYPVSDEDYNGLSKSIAVDYNSGEMSMYLERVGANPIDQDVIYAVESNLSNANGGSVQFHYEHLLSKLNFKVSVSGNVSAITINSIGLKNFASEGIYNYVNNNISPDYVINTTDELMLIDEPLTLQSGQTEILESQLMLPQSLLASYTDGNSPVIVINYVVSSNGTQTENSLTYSLEKGFYSWDSGNSYTYTLKINSSSISIDGEVGDFEDNGNADINPDSPDNPEQTPIEPQGGYVIPEGAKTYTVEVDVEGYVDVASMHNIAGLIAGADPEATIQMAYLNENGEMAWQDWTVTDGWFGVEGACYWGNGSIVCIKPNADGTFANICALPGFEIGTSATAIFNYGNNVIVAITAKVVAEPSSSPVFSISPAASVVEIPSAGGQYNATITSSSGYKLVHYRYDENWGLTQISQEWGDEPTYDYTDNGRGNITVTFAANYETTINEYLFAVPTHVYEQYDFIDDLILDYGDGWEADMSEAAEQYLVAVFVQNMESTPPVTPESTADYVLDVQVVQDNGWGATYFALDGTDVTGWSAYEDADIYVNPVSGVSVDITAEIEAALGIEIGTLKDEIMAGAVLMGAYNANNEFMDCYEIKGTNYFYWFDADGSALPLYSGYVGLDNIGFVRGDEVRLYGNAICMPNRAVVGSIYPTYVVFKTHDDAEYVVQVNQHIVAEPKEIELEFEVVKTYNKTYSAVNPGAYTTPDPIFTLEDIMPNIESMIGGEPDMLLMGCADGIFQKWLDTDGWFGADGAASWGSQTQMFCLRPKADGTFSYCAAREYGECNAKCTYRYANSATLKAVDVVVTVALTAE